MQKYVPKIMWYHPLKWITGLILERHVPQQKLIGVQQVHTQRGHSNTSCVSTYCAHNSTSCVLMLSGFTAQPLRVPLFLESAGSWIILLGFQKLLSVEHSTDIGYRVDLVNEFADGTARRQRKGVASDVTVREMCVGLYDGCP